MLAAPVEACTGAALEQWVSLVMSIVRCTRPNTLLRAMDREWAQGHNETTTGKGSLQDSYSDLMLAGLKRGRSG